VYSCLDVGQTQILEYGFDQFWLSELELIVGVIIGDIDPRKSSIPSLVVLGNLASISWMTWSISISGDNCVIGVNDQNKISTQ
jgi:hypothetical protein